MISFRAIVRCLSGMVLAASLFVCSSEDDQMLQTSGSVESNDVSMDDDMDFSSHFLVQYYDSILNSPEWKEYGSLQQRLDALQLPEQTLSDLTTEDLVIACVYYPMTLNYLAFNDQLMGIRQVIANFNGYAELKKRPDGVKCLIDYYEMFGKVLNVDYSDDEHIIIDNWQRADVVGLLLASGYYELDNNDIARIYNALRVYIEYYSSLSIGGYFVGYQKLMDICIHSGYDF